MLILKSNPGDPTTPGLRLNSHKNITEAHALKSPYKMKAGLKLCRKKCLQFKLATRSKQLVELPISLERGLISMAVAKSRQNWLPQTTEAVIPLLPAMLTIDAGQSQPSAAPTPSQPVPTPTPSHVQITTPPITSTPPSTQRKSLTQLVTTNNLHHLILQLIKKIKKLENKLRQKRKREETEDEEDAEGQDQDIPSQTDQGNKFATPEKSKDSRRAQAEQIRPSYLRCIATKLN
ncbi:hypothetical protein Tco_0878607 [Tanacetum coccineum]|uniref:Uncharacterized protein n=1 Tax=Tanacetum coccineum TaxID=301880 RepID=A0ABQ5BYS4_9ASTR